MILLSFSPFLSLLFCIICYAIIIHHYYVLLYYDTINSARQITESESDIIYIVHNALYSENYPFLCSKRFLAIYVFY